MASRFRLGCTLMALALPICNLFLATLCLLCGKDICLESFDLLSTRTAIAAVTLTSPLIVLRASAVVEGILWVLFCLMTFFNLVHSNFWSYLPQYIIGLVVPFKWKGPADNTSQG